MANADGATYGVGMPVVAFFSKKITDGKALLDATKATVDGKPVRDPIQLTRSIGSHPPGATVKLEIVRDGKSREVEVNLGRRPDETDQARRLAPRGRRAE